MGFGRNANEQLIIHYIVIINISTDISNNQSPIKRQFIKRVWFTKQFWNIIVLGHPLIAAYDVQVNTFIASYTRGRWKINVTPDPMYQTYPNCLILLLLQFVAAVSAANGARVRD